MEPCQVIFSLIKSQFSKYYCFIPVIFVDLSCYDTFAFLFLLLVIGRNSLGAVWRKIMIAPPRNQDLLNIVLKWYPELMHLAQKLIGWLILKTMLCSLGHYCYYYSLIPAFLQKPLRG